MTRGKGRGSRALTAVALTFLMVTSVITPVGASMTATTAGNDDGSPVGTEVAGNDAPTEISNESASSKTNESDSDSAGENAATPGESVENLSERPPVIKQAGALELTSRLDADRRGIASHIERAHERFNRSLQQYRGPVRVNGSDAFTNDAVGIRALAHLTRTEDPSDAKRVADLIYAADNETATATVADARRVLERYGDEMDNQGLRISAEKHLENAERALERGQNLREADGRQYFSVRAQAITQLRQAHRHANLAMGFVDRETAPTVSVTTEKDPIWDGTGNRTYTVRGNLSTVRPTSIDNVTVTVNGQRSIEANTDFQVTAPGETASYAAELNLTERVNRIEVTVTANASNQGQRRHQEDTAVLRLDGDGLPGSYENSTVGTDPLHPDSNSSETAADESADGMLDGREDFDDDRLSTIEEIEEGTDPLEADTDGDDLTDWQELAVVGMDPSDADSNASHTAANESSNGVLDGAEDIDADGLTNAREFSVGSSPIDADTDFDQLNDSTELDLGTDPTSPDTDNDSLDDATELEEPFDTDPLDPDTNDNGIEDGNETYTTVASNESLGATVSLTGEGNAASATEIDLPTNVRFAGDYGPSSVATSEFVHVDVDRTFTSANVTLEYDESAVKTNESSIALYRFNESTGAYERLPSTVDAANDTVTGTTSEFSIVVGFDKAFAQQLVRERTQQRTNTGSSGSTQSTSFDFETSSPVPIASGSTETVNGATWHCRNDPRGGQYSDTPISGACKIADGSATVREETNRMRYLETNVTLPNVDSDGALFVNASLDAQIQSQWSTAAVRLIVENDSSSSVNVFAAERDWNGGTTTVSASPRMDVSEMAGEEVTISLRADGRWTYQSDNTMSEISVDDLNIEKRGNANVDSDGDGIPDVWEEDGVPLANTTRTVELDPNDPDTDGDGIEDGDEVDINTFHADQDLSDADVIHFPGYAWSSDPVVGNTDNDDLPDSLERDGWDVSVVNTTNGPNPYRFDTECEAVKKPSGEYRWSNCEQSGELIEVSSDPTDSDTDGDGLPDYVEYNSTYTDPSNATTYGITSDHQDFIDDLEGNRRLAKKLSIREDGDVGDLSLDDASDDFDFVMTDGSSARERVRYTALDGEIRTDRWASNFEEVAYGRVFDGQLDPWDPDTDDDGLTDGQELLGLTNVQELLGPTKDRYTYLKDDDSVSYHTDPTDPDTDGDGYWDGWIGVYDVNRSDNVVLYREHLQDDDDGDGQTSDDGVQGDEIVKEQTQLHHVSSPTPGVDVDGDGVREHSKLHIGELQWETNPSESQNEPNPSYSLEVDYYDDTTASALNDANWANGIEENYALYGIEVDITRDETLDNNDLKNPIQCVGGSAIGFGISGPIGAYIGSEGACVGPDNGFRTTEIAVLGANHASVDSDGYMFIGDNPEPGPFLDQSNTGVNLFGNPSMAIFADQWNVNAYGINQQTVRESAYSTRLQLLTAKTTLHEIGHGLNIGRADDTKKVLTPKILNNGEIYSGSGEDKSLEFAARTGTARWTPMISGWESDLIFSHNSYRYYVFSIEEMSTIRD